MKITTPLTSTLILLACNCLHAGTLHDLYERYQEVSTNSESAEYLYKAAEQRVITAKRHYLPRISSNAKVLWIDQDVEQEDTTVFREGRDRYGNNRLRLTLDQPLIDLMIKPQIDAEKAMLESSKLLLSQAKSDQTRIFLETFLEASEHYGVMISYDPVIAKLEIELDKVSKSFDEKLATVEDVENVKAALAAMKHEKRTREDKLKSNLATLGENPDIYKEGWVTLIDGAKLKSSTTEDPLPIKDDFETQALRAEVDAYTQLIKAKKSESLPRLSLYGLYQYDDSDGSEFGGSRRLSGYEVGLSLDWDIFDRGISRSEARELHYLKRAKEAELQHIHAESSRANQIYSLTTKLAESNLESMRQLVQHKKAIRDATQDSHESGGDSTYINMINAMLVHEAHMRQYVIAKHEALEFQIVSQAAQKGWNDELIASVDPLFTK